MVLVKQSLHPSNFGNNAIKVRKNTMHSSHQASSEHPFAEMLRKAGILRGAQTRGQNQKWLPPMCLLGGPKQGGTATECMRSWGSGKKGTKKIVAASRLPSQGRKRGWYCYVTRGFSGVHKQRDKIRSGCLNPAFLGAQKRAELLHNPYVLGATQTRGQNTTQHDTSQCNIPPRAQEPAMFDRGTRGRFLHTLSPQNSTAEPGVGPCARPWAAPYRGKKIVRCIAPGHARPLLPRS